MREIFFDEKLGETRRGCEPHGQRWGASRTGKDGSGGSGGSSENKKSEPF